MGISATALIIAGVVVLIYVGLIMNDRFGGFIKWVMDDPKKYPNRRIGVCLAALFVILFIMVMIPRPY